MSYLNYSEFNNFSLNIFSSIETDIQLPSIKLNDNLDNYAIYIHSLKEANVFSSLKKDNELEDFEIIHGWKYRYGISENDFIKYILSSISDTESVEDLKSKDIQFDIYTILQDKHINFYSLMFHEIMNSYKHNHHRYCFDNRLVIPPIHGPVYDPLSCNNNYFPTHTHETFFRKNVLEHKIVPGLSLKFDNKNKFVGVIVKPLSENKNKIRKEFVDQLLQLIDSEINFFNFKELIDTYYSNFVYQPIIDIYHYVNDCETYIQRINCSSRKISPISQKEIPEELMIKYMNSNWKKLFFNEDIGTIDEFINIDQLSVNYKKRNKRVDLQTLYLSSIAKAFNIPLDVYKEIYKQDDLVLVAPYELLKYMKESIVRLWMHLGDF